MACPAIRLATVLILSIYLRPGGELTAKGKSKKETQEKKTYNLNACHWYSVFMKQTFTYATFTDAGKRTVQIEEPYFSSDRIPKHARETREAHGRRKGGKTGKRKKKGTKRRRKLESTYIKIGRIAFGSAVYTISLFILNGIIRIIKERQLSGGYFTNLDSEKSKWKNIKRKFHEDWQAVFMWLGSAYRNMKSVDMGYLTFGWFKNSLRKEKAKRPRVNARERLKKIYRNLLSSDHINYPKDNCHLISEYAVHDEDQLMLDDNRVAQLISGSSMQHLDNRVDIKSRVKEETDKYETMATYFDMDQVDACDMYGLDLEDDWDYDYKSEMDGEGVDYDSGNSNVVRDDIATDSDPVISSESTASLKPSQDEKLEERVLDRIKKLEANSEKTGDKDRWVEQNTSEDKMQTGKVMNTAKCWPPLKKYVNDEETSGLCEENMESGDEDENMICTSEEVKMKSMNKPVRRARDWPPLQRVVSEGEILRNDEEEMVNIGGGEIIALSREIDKRFPVPISKPTRKVKEWPWVRRFYEVSGDRKGDAANGFKRKDNVAEKKEFMLTLLSDDDRGRVKDLIAIFNSRICHIRGECEQMLKGTLRSQRESHDDIHAEHSEKEMIPIQFEEELRIADTFENGIRR